MNNQAGILDPVPRLARYQFYSINQVDHCPEALDGLLRQADGDSLVVGFGESLLRSMGVEVEGLRLFPSYHGPGYIVPSTPAALWCWFRGDDRGELLHRSRTLQQALAPAFRLEKTIDAFRYGSGLDLTGYEDGTENPKGAEAIEAAIVQGGARGLDGSSFVAVQQWVHDLDRFESLSGERQDHSIGRRKSGNTEIEDAPESAHVKRTAQESFDPEAFVVRRSMPWAEGDQAGLVFVAFGRSLDAFEAQLTRMTGGEDGIVDALFGFTQPVTGSYFWCPPMKEGKLDLGLFKNPEL